MSQLEAVEPRTLSPEEIDILTAIENNPDERFTIDQLGEILGVQSGFQGVLWLITNEQDYGAAFRKLEEESDILRLGNTVQITSANLYRAFRENKIAREGGPKPKK